MKRRTVSSIREEVRQSTGAYYDTKMAVSADPVRTFDHRMALLRVFFLLVLLLPLFVQAQRPALPKPAPAQALPTQRAPVGPRPAMTVPPKGKGSPIRLLGAGRLEGGDFGGVKIRKLLGNVSFQQDDVLL